MKKPKFDWGMRLDDTSEFEEFLSSLPEKDRRALLQLIEKVEQRGLLDAIKLKWVKKLDDGIFELRSEWNHNIQRALYFQKVDN